MTDPRSIADEPQTFADLPIQPTGSGVQDLEIAYEQMRLTDADAPAVSTEDGQDAAESEAHPS